LQGSLPRFDMMKVKAGVKSATIHAVITRADGTKEDLGVIAEYKRPLLVRVLKWLRLS